MTILPRSAAVLLVAMAATACGTVEIEIEPEDVSGTVVDQAGAPLPGAHVLVGDTVTITDQAGRFQASGVTLPYDVAIQTDQVSSAFVFLGMSGPAATYRFGGVFAPGSVARGKVSVTLPTVDTGAIQAQVAVEVTDKLAWATVTPTMGQPGTFDVGWRGAPSAHLRIHALRYQTAMVTGDPAHYIGYDTTDAVLDDGGDLSWSASWKPPPFADSTVSATVALPPGYTLTQSTLSVRPAGFVFGGATASATGPATSFVVPDLAGASFTIEADATDGFPESWSLVPALAAGTSGAPVQVDPAPTLTSPADGASFGVGSTMTWTAAGDGPTGIIVQVGLAGPRYIMFADGGSATLPDLSPLGLALPPGASVQVQIFRDNVLRATWEGLTGVSMPTEDSKPSTGGMSSIGIVVAR
jgi:hypothetical protein